MRGNVLKSSKSDTLHTGGKFTKLSCVKTRDGVTPHTLSFRQLRFAS